MKAGTNLSRLPLSFNVIDTKLIGHPASTYVQFRGKEPALYFSNKPTRPARGANPPPPKKKKKKKEKELSFFYTLQKLKKRHDTGFYYIHSEITLAPCNLIGTQQYNLHM